LVKIKFLFSVIGQNAKGITVAQSLGWLKEAAQNT